METNLVKRNFTPEGYASFCRVRQWRQTSRGLRYAFRRLCETGDGTWLLICHDIAIKAA